MTSTSCITGTGFMKCMPITCSGRFVRAAISVIEIELVFVARIAPASAAASRSREDLELEIAILGRRFDDERRALHARRSTCAVATRPRIASLSAGLERALLDLPIEVARDRALSALERVGRDVDHRDVESALREHVRDAIAHLSCTDHGHTFGH